MGDVEVVYKNADKYVGKLKDGKPVGFGSYIFGSGDKYQGDFVDGLE